MIATPITGRQEPGLVDRILVWHDLRTPYVVPLWLAPVFISGGPAIIFARAVLPVVLAELFTAALVVSMVSYLAAALARGAHNAAHPHVSACWLTAAEVLLGPEQMSKVMGQLELTGPGWRCCGRKTSFSGRTWFVEGLTFSHFRQPDPSVLSGPPIG